VPAVLLAAQLAACSGGGAGFAPQQQRAASAAKTTAATFTIQWTSATAPAAVRRKDTISPAAQSITISINGTLSTIANRNGQSSQSITLIAPIGNDQFLFNVYDLQNGSGHLLGTATVSQLIVDGAANQVSATIQAVCAQTNVSYVPASDPTAWVTLGTAGRAQTVASIVVAGQAQATLIIEPEDADGDVIITNNGGAVNYSITGSASVTPVDGAHIQLAPLTGPRTTTPDTLTVSAPSCPSTNVGVQHSPAIYVQNTNSGVYVVDWYGDYSLLTSSMTSGDVLVGYNATSQKLIAYNASFGNVYTYDLHLGTRTPLNETYIGSTVAWSTFIGGLFGIVSDGGIALYFSDINGTNDTTGFEFGAVGPVAAGTLPGDDAAFAIIGGLLWGFTVSSSGPYETGSTSVPYTVANLAVLGSLTGNGYVYGFNSSGGQYVTKWTESLGGGASSSYGFSGNPQMGGVDTDAGYLYAMVGGYFEASSSSGTALSLPSLNFGTPAAIVVVSSNE
jgi:hypothetical protein